MHFLLYSQKRHMLIMQNLLILGLENDSELPSQRRP